MQKDVFAKWETPPKRTFSQTPTHVPGNPDCASITSQRGTRGSHSWALPLRAHRLLIKATASMKDVISDLFETF